MVDAIEAAVCVEGGTAKPASGIESGTVATKETGKPAYTPGDEPGCELDLTDLHILRALSERPNVALAIVELSEIQTVHPLNRKKSLSTCERTIKDRLPELKRCGLVGDTKRKVQITDKGLRMLAQNTPT